MTPQPCQQTITILILPNIFQSKSNHIVKFGQLIEYNTRHYAENEAGRLVPHLFLFF